MLSSTAISCNGRMIMSHLFCLLFSQIHQGKLQNIWQRNTERNQHTPPRLSPGRLLYYTQQGKASQFAGFPLRVFTYFPACSAHS